MVLAVVGAWSVRWLGGLAETPGDTALIREFGGVAVTALVVGTAVASLLGAVARQQRQSSTATAIGAWVLTLRWIAWLGIFSLLVQLTFADPRLPLESGVILWSMTALLLVFNALLTHRGADYATAPRPAVWQIVVDSVALCVALQVTGGIVNPFGSLFVVLGVMAALLLSQRSAGIAIGLVALGPLALALVDVLGILSPLCIDFNVHACMARDRLSVGATGVALAGVTVGAGLIVTALKSRYVAQHSALAASVAARSEEALELTAIGQRLREERGRLDAVLDCIADAIVFADPQGKVVLQNQASMALWPAHQGCGVADLKVCHDPAKWQEVLRRLADPKPIEEHPVLRVGDRLFEATWGRVALAGDAELLGAVMVARDVTDRVREQTMREHRERLATLGTVAAALAHEINNPLSSIQLYAQHASKALAAQPDLVDHMATIQRNADVCKRIVRDLLAYARQRVPEKNPVPVSGLLQLAMKTVKPIAEREEVSIRIDDDSLSALINADRDQIVQILVNFALNAIEAMRHNPPGAPRDLGLEAARQDGGEIALTVTDSGPGIPDSDRELIFSPFFTTRAEGTGLGLAVSLDIARAHGGRIVLGAPASGGASFCLVVPGLMTTARAEAVSL